MHEFGHYLDSRVWGPLFSFAVGIPSAISAGSSDNLSTAPYSTHHYYWTEKRANRKATDYFGKYHNVDWFNDTFVYRNKNILMKKSILPICINSPIQRFYTIFGGAFLLIVSLGGCKIPGERGYEVNNLSSDTICVYFSTGYYDFGPTAYPDTLLPEDKAVSGKYVGRLSESILGDFIPPHTKLDLYHFLLWDDEGMPKIPSLPKDTFSVFFHSNRYA